MLSGYIIRLTLAHAAQRLHKTAHTSKNVLMVVDELIELVDADSADCAPCVRDSNVASDAMRSSKMRYKTPSN